MKSFVWIPLLLSLVACGDDGRPTDAAADATIDAIGDATADAPTDAVTDATTDSGGGVYVDSFVRDSCAPDDGQALEITLYATLASDCMADSSAATLTIGLFSGTDIIFPIMAGSTITSMATDSGFGNGYANLCPGGAAPCLNSQTFTITFTDFVQDVSAAGTYSITFEGGRVETGSFDATWCGGDALCG